MKSKNSKEKFPWRYTDKLPGTKFINDIDNDIAQKIKEGKCCFLCLLKKRFVSMRSCLEPNTTHLIYDKKSKTL